MQTKNRLHRITLAIAAVTVLGTLALSAAGCSTTTSAAPTTEPVAQAGSPTGSSAAVPAPGAVHGTGLAAAAPAPTPKASSGPTAAQGKAVVQESCIGQCHGNNLLTYRASASRSQQIAASMGAKAGVSADKQVAIALFFAQ